MLKVHLLKVYFNQQIYCFSRKKAANRHLELELGRPPKQQGLGKYDLISTFTTFKQTNRL
jgi:hypothetical protein